MSAETLVIENVDVELLEKQRRALHHLLGDVNQLFIGAPKDIELVEGLVNMLDAWSDERERRGE